MTDSDNRVIRPFADFIREQRKGAAHDDLSVALNDLLSAVRAHNKGGSLTLTLKVEPLKDNPEVVTILDDIKVKAPQQKRKPSVFYVTDDGNPSREDPNQMKFEGMHAIEGDADERTPDHAERAAGDA